jgi:hypothetical protein
MTLRRHLVVSPERAFAAFAAVEEVGAWVPGILDVTVLERGEHSLVARFVRTESDGTERRYELEYELRPSELRVAWWPRRGHEDAVRGWAGFEADGTGCSMTYVVQHGALRGDLQELLRLEAVRALHRFVEFAAARGDAEGD